MEEPPGEQAGEGLHSTGSVRLELRESPNRDEEVQAEFGRSDIVWNTVPASSQPLPLWNIPIVPRHCREKFSVGLISSLHV